MAILFDFTGLCIAGVMGDFAAIQNKPIDVNYVRHMTYNTIRFNVSKFRLTYGRNIVFAMDSSPSWRKQWFPYYKGNRKRDAKIDWIGLFKAIEEVQNDVKNYFPYKSIQIAGAEADDVIAVLAEFVAYFNKTKSIDEDILVVSRDKDFKQLQRIPRLKQWNPVDKKFVHSENPVQELHEMVLHGDSGDGVPNVLSADDTFVSVPRKRQTTINDDRWNKLLAIDFASENPPVDEWYSEMKKGAIDFSELMRRYNRNKNLIDFACIPADLKQTIRQAYVKQPIPPLSVLVSHLVDKRMKLMVPYANEF